MGLGLIALVYGVFIVAAVFMLLQVSADASWPKVDIPEGWKVAFCLAPLVTVVVPMSVPERWYLSDDQSASIFFASAAMNALTAIIAGVLMSKYKWYLLLLIPAMVLAIIFLLIAVLFSVFSVSSFTMLMYFLLTPKSW